MRRALLLSILLAACGLTARGTGEADAGAGITDAGAARDAPDDAPTDATVDTVEAAPCVVTVEDAFVNTTFDPALWSTTANPTNAARGFPRPQIAGTVNTARFLDDQVQNVRAAIWHPHVLPFLAFDIEFDSYAVCSGPSCGDGIAVAFLTKATPAQLAAADNGATFGIPKNLAGGAVAVDLATTPAWGETNEPAILVLDLDGTDPVMPRNWVLDTSASLTKLVDQGARRIKLSLRGKTVSVLVDGVEEASATFPHLPDEGMFGFTASSGLYNATLAIGDVRATFYRCNAP